MPTKEIHFFDQHFERGLDWYLEHFQDPPAGKTAIGEITPNYLASSAAIERIASTTPNVKLFAILREPVARAYSAYHLMRSHGYYKGVTFEQAMTPDSPLVREGLYGHHLTNLLQHFDSRQLCVLFYEDIQTDPAGVMRSLQRFIGVDPDFAPSSLATKYNLSAGSRIYAMLGLPAILKQIRRSPAMPLYQWLSTSAIARGLRDRMANTQSRQSKRHTHSLRLRAMFADDIRLLEPLVERDLSCWQR